MDRGSSIILWQIFSHLNLSRSFFSAAVLAGFLDTLAGGGGLITVPVLLLSGMPND